MGQKDEAGQRKRWDKAIETGAIDAELRPTRMRVAQANELASTISFRLSIDEHRRVRDAAHRSGLSMSEFLRAAAMVMADDRLTPKKAEMLKSAEASRRLLHEATELSHVLVAKLEQLAR
jgi:hypothetical protein